MRGYFVPAVVTMAVACTKSDGNNERLARENVKLLVDTAAADIAEIERGLPEGAARLRTDSLSSQTAKEIAAVRRQVVDLNSAKTVVFGIVNLEGIWLATDAEKDPYAGNAVGQNTEPLLSGAKGQAVYGNIYPRERRGKYENAYLAAAAIRDTKGNINGYFVTGLSLAEYAYRLQEALKNHWAARMRSATKGNDTLPIFYVVLATPRDLHPAPKVPAVNVEALKTEGVFAKARTNASGALTISDRKFAYATAMLPRLGSDIAVAVLHSEP
jgi:hypothetical protein